MTSTAHTYCDLCLSTCGLEVDIDSGRIVAVRSDPPHPFSAGYLCVSPHFPYDHERRAANPTRKCLRQV